MGLTGKIRVNFDNLKSNYPTYAALPKSLQDYLDGLNRNIPEGQPKNTPCCLQVSHALNKAGRQLPPRSFWRDNEKIGLYFYIRAVNELEQYLSGAYGRVEDIKRDPSGKQRSMNEMKQYINGKQGILVFGGMHTELWDKTHIMQDGGPRGERSGDERDSYIWHSQGPVLGSERGASGPYARADLVAGLVECL